MLRRITPSQVRLGMFIQKFEGGWLSHPFWRARFLLSDAEDLRKILDSDIDAVWIDDEKSAIVPARRERTPAPEISESVGDRIKNAREAAIRALPPPSRLQTDKRAAAQTVLRAKQVVKQVFDGIRMGKAVRSADVIAVVEDISASLAQNRSLLLGIARLKSKDEYTYLHSVAVCALMVNLAREIGLDDAAARDAGMAGLLHDVGKMVVAEAILNKPGPLTDHEFGEIQRHTVDGHALLKKGSAIPAAALDVCLNHHEKMDGTGYPHGLSGEEISLHARMGAICDVYDAMTSQRCYKAPLTPAETLTAMRSWEGHFDSALLFSFMRSLALFPPGMLVRLGTGHLAVVLPNGRRGSRVRVKAFYVIADGRFVDPFEVIISDTQTANQIMGEEDPAAWDLRGWPVLRETIMAEGTVDKSAAA